jgi:hypothetical protein
MTGKIPAHTISNIVKASCVISDKYDIPKVPQELMSAIIRNQSEVSSVEEEKDDTNERFYVDETNMIERRFLKNATDTFEPERDIDIFAGSDLFESLLECALVHPSLKSIMSEFTTKNFLSSGTVTGTNMMSIAPELLLNSSFETGRVRFLKENPDKSSQEAVMILSDTSQDDFNRVSSLAFLIGTPIVIEEMTGKTRIYGPTPSTQTDMIYWIRGVVDGWLGTTLTANDAEMRFQKSELVRYNPDLTQNGSPLIRNKKVLVADLKIVYESLYGEKPHKMKKAELQKCVSEKCLWGIHIDVISHHHN